MKILLWGISSAANEFQIKILNDLSKAFFTVEKNESKNILKEQQWDLIINHDGWPNGITKPMNLWLINTSASAGNKIPPSINIEGTISWNTLVENLVSFLNFIEKKTALSKEDIEILYAIDPELERLLEPFDTANPFKENQNLKDAKVELKKHTDLLLAKLIKS